MERKTIKKIKLEKISDIQDLVGVSYTIAGDVIISSADGKYKVNGKSLLGVMSLDLSRPVLVEFPTEDFTFKQFLDRFAIED